MELRSSILRELQARDFIHQCTDFEGLDDGIFQPPATAYVGFDCTAPSLHIGNLISIMMLRWWQKKGHRPIVLLGGATTRIGDPSGKEETRKLLDEESIEKNIQRIKNCFQKYLKFEDSPAGALLVNNRDWLDDLNYINFLRDYGRHFSVNRMLGFDSVKTRLEREQNLSFLEFNYMVFQAYDFLELSRRHDCILQIGGADQWGNIVNGMELARRIDQKQIFGLTSPLITTANGQKMGKTASGAVWLDASMTSPWDYWQYWRNVDDKDVGRFLRLFTDIPVEKIVEMERPEYGINDAKISLADEATSMLHGAEILSEIHAGVEASFGGDSDKESSAIPSVGISRETLQQEYGLLKALVAVKLADTNSEARRHVRDGAVRVNGEIIKDEKHHLMTTDITPNQTIKLSVGRKKHALLRIE
ncbi:MAG: tyrosine--tRNA ligase [Hyphomicrobiales bacterium]|nr:tyrosine--tRNA ligase [Hyphomicrobiales bacterium]MCY4033851.1 tyrosine--tRNA ligase [Hyphomicrobiales bacterium]MCY4039125.1 tyrosine--tRNA ligase [Hyphomicrobiales bacterium]